MKKFLIFLTVIVLLIVGVFAYALMNVNSLIVKFKPDLEKLASNAVGSPVRLGALTPTIFPTTSIRAEQFSVGGGGLSLGALVVEIKLLSLLQGRLDLDTLVIERPKVSLLKSASGISIVGLPAKSSQRTQDDAKGSASAHAPSTAAPTAASPLAVNLRKVQIKGGVVHFEDKTATPPRQIEVGEIELFTAASLTKEGVKAENFSLTGNIRGLIPQPVPFNLSDSSISLSGETLSIGTFVIAVLDQKIHLGGELNITTKDGKVTVTAPAPLQLKPLASAAAAVAPLPPVGGTLSPNITVTLTKGAPSVQGSLAFAGIEATLPGQKISEGVGTINLSASPVRQNVRIENFSLLANGAPIKLSFDSSLEELRDAILKSLSISAFGGTIQSAGEFRLTDTRWRGDVTVAGVQIEPALRAAAPELPTLLTGTVTSIKARAQGVLGAELIPALTSEGTFEITDASLKGVNLASEVLKAVNNLPLIQGSLYELLPPDVEKRLAGKDTPIELLKGTFQVANAKLTPVKLYLKSGVYSLEADGTIGFDKSLDLRATITFSPELSRALAQRAKDLSKVFDAEGRLVIPLVLKGTLPKVIVLPNVEKLVQLAGRRAIEEQGTKALERLLGGKKKGRGLLGF